MPPKAKAKAKGKAKAKAKVRAKAKAVPKRGARRGVAPRRGARVQLRRPARGGGADPGAVPEAEPEEGKFEEGSWVASDSLPLSHLSEGAEIVGEGSYWGAPCKICGRVQNLLILGDKTTEVGLEATGTDHEELLKWISGQPGHRIRLHLCGSLCPNRIDANGLVHAQRVRKKVDGDRGGWAENLQVEHDELAVLREEAMRREEAEKVEDKKEGKDKKKKKKDRKRSSSSEGRKGKKKEKRSIQKPEGQKPLDQCFGRTGWIHPRR